MPRYERLVNNSQTTLNGAINDSVTSVVVDSASSNGYPLLGDFRILVGSEVMHVTSRVSNTLTVVRGVDGTTAASHADGANVNLILTQTGLQAYFNHILPGCSHKNAARLLDDSANVVTSSDFSWDNQGLAYVEDNLDGSITLGSDDTDTSGARIHVLYKSAPSAPWTLTVAFQILGWNWSGSGASTTGGICCRESGTGEFINFTVSPSSPAAGQTYGVFHWNSPTSFNTSIPGALAPDFNSNWTWLQIEDDNTNLYWRASQNGLTWHQIASDVRTDFMAAGPDQIGITLSERGIGTASSRNPKHEITVKTWLEE